MDWIPAIGALGIGALGGAVTGAIITQLMTNARDRRSQLIAHRKQQLEQFYGPLLAAHKEIRARSELRLKLQTALDSSHTEDMFSGGISGGPAGVAAASDRHIPAILANVQDENQTFRDVLMPRYRDMLNVFREKMWLAEPETREFYQQFVEFVDVWDKILADKLPRSIAVTIDHTEQNLKPFYAHLEEVHDRFRRDIG